MTRLSVLTDIKLLNRAKRNFKRHFGLPSETRLISIDHDRIVVCTNAETGATATYRLMNDVNRMMLAYVEIPRDFFVRAS